METNSILSANILDILFEGRNKDYGAYELRNTYNQRVNRSLGITAIVVMIVVLGFTGKTPGNRIARTIIKDVEISKHDPEKKIPVPLQKVIKVQQTKSEAVTPPVIVIDKLVTKTIIENDKMDAVRIDTKTFDGPIENGPTPPLEIRGSNVIEGPVKKESKEDGILIIVEKEASFTGNWNAYVKKEIEKYIDELTEAGESGTCLVQFVVSKDGSVSNVEALTLKGTKLAEIAVNAIRKGPKWIPAEQNGTIVNAYRKQPITFTISN